jgi:hypothetical protein
MYSSLRPSITVSVDAGRFHDLGQGARGKAKYPLIPRDDLVRWHDCPTFI